MYNKLQVYLKIYQDPALRWYHGTNEPLLCWYHGTNAPLLPCCHGCNEI